MAYRRPLAVAYSCGAVAEFHRASRLSGQRIAAALLCSTSYNASSIGGGSAQREMPLRVPPGTHMIDVGQRLAKTARALLGWTSRQFFITASCKNHWRRSFIDSPIEVDPRMWVLGRSPDSRGVDRNGLPRIAPSGLLRSVSLRLQWRGPCRSLTGFPTTPSSSFIGEQRNIRQGILGPSPGVGPRGESAARAELWAAPAFDCRAQRMALIF